MSLNRGRNIFTLGNFQASSKRRQPNDPFERDPFKIQSYNFRYAERPSFKMPAVKQRVNNNSESVKQCQTYFYNYDFPVAHNSCAQRNTKTDLNLNKFQEHRRRKFLHETTTKKNSHLTECNQKPYDSKILNLYYGKQNTYSSLDNSTCSQKSKSNYTHSNNQNLYITRSSSNSLHKNFTVKQPSSLKTLNSGHQLLSSTSQDVCNGHTRSLSSGCEININIKSLEDNSLQDNVNIKIDTDSLSRNLNIPLTKSSSSKVQRLISSDTFIIDKRLSKFSENPVKPCDIKKSDKERVKELTSIYSSQILKKFNSTGQVKSAERMPTLIPFRTSTSRVKNGSSCAKENFLQRVNDNKAASKGSSYNNNLYRSPYVQINGQTKTLNCPSLTTKPKKLNNTTRPPLKSSIHSLTSAANRYEFKPTAPLRLRSSSKLPLNVNINVFADKLKLLKL